MKNSHQDICFVLYFLYSSFQFICRIGYCISLQFCPIPLSDIRSDCTDKTYLHTVAFFDYIRISKPFPILVINIGKDYLCLVRSDNFLHFIHSEIVFMVACRTYIISYGIHSLNHGMNRFIQKKL